MGINSHQATACYGGLGNYVYHGENRVNDLECHANCLRERLDRLEAMLPSTIIDASIAVQKGEKPPDLLELVKADEKGKDEKRNAEIGRKDSSPCVTSGCGKSSFENNIIDDEDQPQICMLQLLAKKEKRLRKKIYEMELKEEQYKKAISKVGKTFDESINIGQTVSKSEFSVKKNQTFTEENQATTSKKDIEIKDPIKKRIEKLETSNKKINLNLKNLHKERENLTCKARNLTEELRSTQKCLGQIQQRVLGNSPSKIIPIMKDPSVNDIYTKALPCSTYCVTKNGSKKLPQDPEALRILAGQYKEAYKKAEDEGFSSSIREPIRKTAERLRALSYLDKNSCPCGQPVKCDSCIVCSCSEWERDLEAGGDDEQLEENSSDGEESEKNIMMKKKSKIRSDKCNCGCDESSSESECPCGCSDLHVEEKICPCNCGQTVESSAVSTSDPSTITETTIPSSETDDSVYNKIGRGDANCHLCNLGSCKSFCEICKNESPQGSSDGNGKNIGNDDECDEKCDCEILNDLSKTCELCKVCPCACGICDLVENKKISSHCDICQTVNAADVSPENYFTPVKCTCSQSSDLPPEIQKICKVETLREGLENLKNRNHVLRNILKNYGCVNEAENSCLSASGEEKTIFNCKRVGNSVKQTISGLICTVRLLQSKCRTKDGMIVALADELKKSLTDEQTSRILECLADPNICRNVNDFDRSELWNYLKISSNNKKSPECENSEEKEKEKEEEEIRLSNNKTNCNCINNFRQTDPQPPRKLTIRSRISSDGLIISWLPPISGPVAGYEVFAEGEIVARIRKSMRTETFVGGLDLRKMILLEVRTISVNGFRSKTVEKLFNPARTKV